MLAAIIYPTLSPQELIMRSVMSENGELTISSREFLYEPLCFETFDFGLYPGLVFEIFPDEVASEKKALLRPQSASKLVNSQDTSNNVPRTPVLEARKNGVLLTCASASTSSINKRLLPVAHPHPVSTAKYTAENQSKSSDGSDASSEEEDEEMRTLLKRTRTKKEIVSSISSRPKYRGIVWEEKVNSYRCKIKFRRHVWYLGLFKDPVKGATAYDFAANFILGKRARLNFPENNYDALPPPRSCPVWLVELLTSMPTRERSSRATRFLQRLNAETATN